MEAQERGFRENIPQMREKLEKEIESLLREQEKVLMHKLKVSLGTELGSAPWTVPWFLRKGRANTNRNQDPRENHKKYIIH